MPIGKVSGGQPQNKSDGDSSEKKMTETVENKARKASDSEIKEIINKASTYSNDEDKYKAAARLAQNQMIDDDEANEEKLKAAIDEYYGQMGAERSADDVRSGGNWWNQTVSDLKDFIEGTTAKGGEALNWAFDNSIGNAVGMIDPDAGKVVQNLFDGKDLQAVVDLGADVALSALGPVGWAAVVGKNAIQQSDNLARAAYGYDPITLGELSDEERWGSGIEGGLGTALSAIPVAGKTGNFIKGAGRVEKAASKAAGETAEGAAESVVKRGGLGGAVDVIRSQRALENQAIRANRINRMAGSKIVDVPEVPKHESIRSILKQAKEASDDLPRQGFGEYLNEVKDYANKANPFSKNRLDRVGRVDARDALRSLSPGSIALDRAKAKTMQRNSRELKSALKKAGEDEEAIEKVYKKFGKSGIGDRIGATIASQGAGIGGITLAGLSQGENYGDMFENPGAATVALSVLPAALAPKKRAIGLRGMLNPLIPSMAYGVNEAMKQSNRVLESRDIETDIDADELLKALKLR